MGLRKIFLRCEDGKLSYYLSLKKTNLTSNTIYNKESY